MLMFVVLMVSMAQADTIKLFSGALIEAELVVYQMDGSCQVSVTGGDLAGTILVTPCSDIQSFERDAPPLVHVAPSPESTVEEPLDGPKPQVLDQAPAVDEIPEEEIKTEPQTPTPLPTAEDAPAASEPVEPFAGTSSSRRVTPVAVATLPPGFTPPGAVLKKSESEQ